jgi:hypothetical protein
MSNGINLKDMSLEQLAKVKRDMMIKDAQLKAAVQIRESEVQAPVGAAKYFRDLANGDALAINNVIWPFFFTTSSDVLRAGGGQQQVSFQVTQEAAFVWTEMVKVVYAVNFDDPTPTIEYIEPSDVSGNGDANGLRFTLSDGDSSRSFMNDYIPLDQVGVPTQPFIPDRPMFLLPLQLMNINLINNNPSRDFVVFLMFKGYRLRIQGTNDLQNLVTR